MLNNIVAVEVSDTTGDDSSNAACPIKKINKTVSDKLFDQVQNYYGALLATLRSTAGILLSTCEAFNLN